MPPPILTLTEEECLAALREFLLTVLPPDTEVVLGQVNRVPEPRGENFVVFWPIRRERLATNETSYDDADFTGSISGTTLTVTSVGHGILETGILLRGGSAAPDALAADTALGEQLTGSIGGTGTYIVSPAQTVALTQMLAGVRWDQAATEYVVQLDIHGPRSGDSAQVIETLLKSDYGTTEFAASGYAVTPLFCESRGQLPFMNAEQQYEDRWVIDAHLQIAAGVGTSQQFFEQVEIDTVVADDLP